MQPRIDLKLAGLYKLKGQFDAALTLLEKSSESALATDDKESLIEINNQMAEIYLTTNKPDKALIKLKNSELYNPFSYPYDLLLSQSYAQKGQLIKAIELANKCKQNANEFWQIEDDEFLSELINKSKKT